MKQQDIEHIISVLLSIGCLLQTTILTTKYVKVLQGMRRIPSLAMIKGT
jgi:hypothetical protein